MHFADVEIEIHHLGNLQNHKLVRGRSGTRSDLQARAFCRTGKRPFCPALSFPNTAFAPALAFSTPEHSPRVSPELPKGEEGIMIACSLRD